MKPTGELTSADLSRLTSLYAPNYRIKTLSGLEAASNLTVLNVTQNDITNADALAGMAQLTSLDLSDNYVRDLSPCRPDKSCQPLPRGDRSRDGAAARHHAGLIRVGLGYNHICDQTPLCGITSLRELDLTANPIST